MQDYLSDQNGDSRLPRRLAAQSRLPNLTLHQAPNHQEPPRQDPRTSMMMSGPDSLPAFTNASSHATTASLSSVVGGNAIGQQQRLLLIRGGALELPPPGRALFECPFHFLYCLMSFLNFNEWLSHSLTHFNGVEPPRSNTCYFCEMRFEASSGRRSWKMLLEHVEMHHALGHTLAHARPNFELHQYLWHKGLIEPADYKALTGNHESSARAAQQAYPSPPGSPDENNPTAYTIDNRRERRPRRS
ncbi:hypothetical protein MMC06_000232 [Schaereria dolodes]|nr:hypothetical protein [Schaereria dolodes]